MKNKDTSETIIKKVGWSDLSWGLKVAVLAGWAYAVLFVVGFLVGFFGGGYVE